MGNGDTVINGAMTIAGPDGFSAAAEWLVVTCNIAEAIISASAAAAIGSASGACAVGRKALFAVDNGSTSGLFLFTAGDADVVVGTAELTLLGQLSATPAIGMADLLVGA